MHLFIITGQTATGKTKLALELAKEYNGELVNCDSRQIYKNLDIITGKDLSLLRSEKIWLYDIIDPKQSFSAIDYKNRAVSIIEDIIQREKTPIIVGGTYFYLQTLLYNKVQTSVPPNKKLRKELDSLPVSNIQEKLKSLDLKLYESLNNSEKHNPQRLIRKIEILKNGLSQQPNQPDRLVDLYRQSKKIDFIGLRFKEKNKLRETITKRVQKRLNEGGIKEVKKLLEKDYTENDPGLKTIGYQQIIKYLKGTLSKEKAVEEWIIKEVQYAKRQYTFMKRDKNIEWKEV